MPTQPDDETLAYLGREIEALREQVGELADLPARMQHLDETLAQAITDFAGGGRRPDPVRPVSWIGGTEPHLAGARLAELADWVARVYLRYPISARELPDCWLWHPDVVEELAWLQQAWQAAYDPDGGTVAAAGDWHDRQRPGVSARIRLAVRSCSLEVHTGDERPTGATVAPSAGSVSRVADWWANHRDEQPPLPTLDDLDRADRRMREGRR